MTLREASDGFSKLTKGISLDEVIDDELEEEEFYLLLPAIPNNNVVDAVELTSNVDVELPVNVCKDTVLPKD